MSIFFVSVDIEGTSQQPKQIGICMCDILDMNSMPNDEIPENKELNSLFKIEIDFKMEYRDRSKKNSTLYNPSEKIRRQCIEFCEKVEFLTDFPWIYWGGPEKTVVRQIFRVAKRSCRIKFIDIHKPWRNYLKFRLDKSKNFFDLPRKPNGNIRSSLKSAIAFVNSLDCYKQTHDALKDAKDNFIVLTHLLEKESEIELVRYCSLSAVFVLRQAALEIKNLKCKQGQYLPEFVLKTLGLKCQMCLRRTRRKLIRRFAFGKN